MSELFLSYFENINRRIYDGKLKAGRVIEGALDENWYSEYQHLYRNDPTASPGAVRVHLKYGRKEGGFFHIRSVRTKVPSYHSKQVYDISESYLIPPPNLSSKTEKSYIKCKDKYHVYGSTVECVPYIMPNPNFGVCAQASAWIVLKILDNLSNGIVKCRPIPKIQKSAIGHPFADSNGLPLDMVARLFKMNGCEVFNYDSVSMGLSFDEMFNIAYAYVESGFPVVLGVDVSKLEWWEGHRPEYHSIVLIGHTLTKKTGKIDGFLLHDESRYPYLKIKKRDLKRAWDIPEENKSKDRKDKPFRKAIVGVPPSVKVGYEATFDHKTVIDFLYRKKILKRKRFPVRPALMMGRDLFRSINIMEFSDEDFGTSLKEKLWRTQLPEWVWFLQFYEHERKRLEREITGGIVFDASVDGSPLFLFLEDVGLVWSHLE